MKYYFTKQRFLSTQLTEQAMCTISTLFLYIVFQNIFQRALLYISFGQQMIAFQTITISFAPNGSNLLQQSQFLFYYFMTTRDTEPTCRAALRVQIKVLLKFMI